MEQTDFVNSRKYSRFDASAIPSLKSVHIVEETEIKLINISRGGALIEAKKRISPGSRVSLKINTTKTIYHLSGQVLRCIIQETDEVMTYQFAVVFDEEFPIIPSN